MLSPQKLREQWREIIMLEKSHMQNWNVRSSVLCNFYESLKGKIQKKGGRCYEFNCNVQFTRQ